MLDGLSALKTAIQRALACWKQSERRTQHTCAKMSCSLLTIGISELPKVSSDAGSGAIFQRESSAKERNFYRDLAPVYPSTSYGIFVLLCETVVSAVA